MKPTLRRRFVRWVCKEFGHEAELTHIHEGDRHYVCKRCRAIGVRATWTGYGNDSVHRWKLAQMRKSERNKLGINGSNADFVEVEDVEE